MKSIIQRVRKISPLATGKQSEAENQKTENSKIVRLLIGHTSGGTGAPESHIVRGQIKNSERYFDDIQSYLVALIGLAHMIEVGKSGKSTPYDPQHTVRLDCARESASWYWSPNSTLQMLASNFVPANLEIERVGRATTLSTSPLNLGAFGNLLEGFGQVLATNFYERHQQSIIDKFGKDPNLSWPNVWNFARVVRNAMSHRGELHFRSSSAPTVSWKGLSYSFSDNGRNILHQDIWPGDLFGNRPVCPPLW
ncbi:hypothetical protein, partial [Hyphomonas oceanitis]|uniref:hypothetical protein n=1 Tax=Hyphomonas oceanitis TaxID=81033 RepID=UPI0012EC4421